MCELMEVDGSWCNIWPIIFVTSCLSSFFPCVSRWLLLKKKHHAKSSRLHKRKEKTRFKIQISSLCNLNQQTIDHINGTNLYKLIIRASLKWLSSTNHLAKNGFFMMFIFADIAKWLFCHVKNEAKIFQFSFSPK